MMRSKHQAAKRPRPTAAAKRRSKACCSWFYEQCELAEQRLLQEQPDLYRKLATATLPELEALALQVVDRGRQTD